MSSCSVSGKLVWLDRVCDYVPGISTVTNLIDIVAKCVLNCFCRSESIQKNHCFSHVNDKSCLRCFILLIPILGNIIVGVFDHHSSRAESKKRKDQNLDPKLPQLPQSAEQCKKKIEKIRQEALCLTWIDLEITSLRKIVETFKIILKEFQDQEDIYLFWLDFKIMNAMKDLINKVFKYGKNQTILSKFQEISLLTKEISELRRTSYQTYIQSITDAELLKEAQKYYLKSFEINERELIKDSVEQMTLETLCPNLKKRVDEVKNNDDRIEIQEIYLLLEPS